MKKILLIAVLIIQATASIAQEKVSSLPLTSDDYLEKSRKQKKAARICMASGVGLLGISLLAVAVVPPDPAGGDETNGTLITGLGLAGIATGTYLHIASKKNKKRAAETTVFFDVKKTGLLSQTGVRNRSYPAFGLRMSL